MKTKIFKGMVAAWLIISLLIVVLSLIQAYWMDVDNSIALGCVSVYVCLPFYIGLTLILTSMAYFQARKQGKVYDKGI